MTPASSPGRTCGRGLGSPADAAPRQGASPSPCPPPAADTPQMSCGEDLISRIVYIEENEGGFTLLRQLLLSGVEMVIAALLRSAPDDGEIVDVTAAGNTVLTHILHGVSPAPIRHPPYQPVIREYPVRTGEETGPLAASSAPWRLFPDR